MTGHLLHSEQTQNNVTEELSKMCRDCLRRQGAEVSYLCIFLSHSAMLNCNVDIGCIFVRPFVCPSVTHW